MLTRKHKVLCFERFTIAERVKNPIATYFPGNSAGWYAIIHHHMGLRRVHGMTVQSAAQE